jgi:hypothetical protein
MYRARWAFNLLFFLFSLYISLHKRQSATWFAFTTHDTVHTAQYTHIRPFHPQSTSVKSLTMQYAEGISASHEDLPAQSDSPVFEIDVPRPRSLLAPALPIHTTFHQTYLFLGYDLGVFMSHKTYHFNDCPDETEAGKQQRIMSGVLSLNSMKYLLDKFRETGLCQLSLEDLEKDLDGEWILPATTDGPPPAMPGSFVVGRTDAGGITFRQAPALVSDPAAEKAPEVGSRKSEEDNQDNQPRSEPDNITNLPPNQIHRPDVYTRDSEVTASPLTPQTISDNQLFSTSRA